MRLCLTGSRKYYIDILKFIAILAVIFCHLQLNAENAINVWFLKSGNILVDLMWYVFGYIFANMSIPMFILLTGANRFRNTNYKSIDYKKLFREICKILLIIIVCQFPFYIYKHIKYGEVLNIKDFIINIYSTCVEPIYWYFPGFLIAFLIAFPLLKRWTLTAEKKDYEYLFVVYAIVSLLINNITKYFHVAINVPFSVFTYTYMCPLFGDLICNKYEKNDIKPIRLIILAICAVSHWLTTEKYEAMNMYLAMIILILCRYVLEFKAKVNVTKQKAVYNLITFTAMNALMFYILHPYVLKIVFKLCNYMHMPFGQYTKYPIAIILIIINYVITYIIVRLYLAFKFEFSKIFIKIGDTK